MKYRPFGRTGLNISEIGFGTWGIGGTWWGGPQDQGALAALRESLDLGVNFFDTAYVYGDGHSEELIGKVVKEKKVRSQVYLATKVPPKNWGWPAVEGSDVTKIFPGSWIRQCTERSLKKLHTDYVDLQQLHVWAPNWLRSGDWLETLQKLQQEGKVRWFGISINDHQPDSALELVRSGLIQSVQVIYNIFDQSPEKNLLPLCREYKVGVIVRVPLDEGGLSGKLTPTTQFAEGDWRRNYFRGDRLGETCDRVEKLKEFLGDEEKTISDLALKFTLAHPAVSTVIPGMRHPEHLRSNSAVSDGKPLSDKRLQALKQHAWPRNFYLD
ncbi:MAG: aldo/keto reductase [Deltaproteobacteria bacterium]|nr:aldo/keto reductase [Deltaproteobacteria bacterium]